MATIRTAIQLYDGMTQPLRSMHQAMTVLIDGFETMQRTSASTINADSIREARIALDRASVTFTNWNRIFEMQAVSRSDSTKEFAAKR